MRTKRVSGNTAYTYYYNGDMLQYLDYDSDTTDSSQAAKLYFVLDAAGNPIEVSYRPEGSTTTSFYYYVQNLQGDVVALVDSANGNTVVTYTYDAWGNVLNVDGSLKTTLGVLNPFRYRGYVYDSDTQLYYLQSRYYDPNLGRFLNPDSYASTGQGILGNNMYAYCLNNPVNYADGNGNRPQFLPTVYEKPSKRDVTEEVMAALAEACSQAQAKRARINIFDENASVLTGELYAEFYLLVNHEAPWDIKRKMPWVETIGTPYPGYNVEVLFNDMVMTPEMLGNYTYGYLGHAYGIPLTFLIAGSYYAAGFPIHGDALENEKWDWTLIEKGYHDFQ